MIIAIIWLWQSYNEGKLTSKDSVTVIEISLHSNLSFFQAYLEYKVYDYSFKILLSSEQDYLMVDFL